MTLRRGKDPLASRLQTGEGLPEKNGWVEPSNNDHLFRAKVSRRAREVAVEARDPWGSLFVERLVL